MFRKPVFAANWKMNHGPTDAKAFLRTFLVHYARRAGVIRSSSGLVVCFVYYGASPPRWRANQNTKINSLRMFLK